VGRELTITVLIRGEEQDCDDWWYLCFVFANLLADAKIGEAHVAVLVEEHVLGLLRSIGGRRRGEYSRVSGPVSFLPPHHLPRALFAFGGGTLRSR
jgi:hypothetical protein